MDANAKEKRTPSLAELAGEGRPLVTAAPNEESDPRVKDEGVADFPVRPWWRKIGTWFGWGYQHAGTTHQM